MRSRRALLVLACGGALARAVAGCAVEGLDINAKECPCVAGYVCDTSTNRCVAEGAGATEPTDGGAPLGAFEIRRFAPTWAASRSVRWDWEVAGDASQFSEYQVIVGSSEDAVRRQDSTTAIFDRRLNPELGSFGGRDPVAAGQPARSFTVTDRHSVDKRVFARLVVRDKAGRENSSAIVSTETMPEDGGSLNVYEDTLPTGATTTPAELKRVTTDCYSGGSGGCLQLAVDCKGAKSCALPIGIEDLNKSLSAMKEADFDDAFLELAVRGGSGAAKKPHSDIVLTVGSPSCKIDGQPCRFRAYAFWSMRPGTKDFRLLQIPLRELRFESAAGPGAPLSYATLAANGHRVTTVGIEGEWADAANIGLDHVFVRW